MKYPGDRRKPPEGVTLTGVIGQSGRLRSAILQEDAVRQADGKAVNDGTGYGLHSGESHEGVGAEGAKRGARISQAKGQRRFQIILVCLFGQMRDSSVLFFAHSGIHPGRDKYTEKRAHGTRVGTSVGIS